MVKYMLLTFKKKIDAIDLNVQTIIYFIPESKKLKKKKN